MSDDQDKEARREFYLKIQFLISGQPVKIALPALLDSVAGLVGYTFTDQEQALREIDVIAEDMKKAMLTNWNKLREVRNAVDALMSGVTEGNT